MDRNQGLLYHYRYLQDPNHQLSTEQAYQYQHPGWEVDSVDLLLLLLKFMMKMLCIREMESFSLENTYARCRCGWKINKINNEKQNDSEGAQWNDYLLLLVEFVVVWLVVARNSNNQHWSLARWTMNSLVVISSVTEAKNSFKRISFFADVDWNKNTYYCWLLMLKYLWSLMNWSLSPLSL